jgi:tetratricopeptide (TPR) repeat protein
MIIPTMEPNPISQKINPRLLQAGAALNENRIPEAEALLRAWLKESPTDVQAIRMFAEVAARVGRYGDAEKLLSRCLELDPGFTAARQNYAVVLHRLNRPAEALREVDRLLRQEPGNPSFRNLQGTILGRIGEYGQAIELYAGVLAQYPGLSKVWMSYGHALKTAGREQESIEAYRRCIAQVAGMGEAWWSLANLKTFRFTPAELTQMQAQLTRKDLSDEDRFHFHFALGKAFEDRGEAAASFEHYSQGNRLRRALIQYDAEENHQHVRRSQALFTPEFFESRRDWGYPARDPIFIVGLPRAGSTLLEQILSSHSQVEGTMELPDMVAIARELGARGRRPRPDAPQAADSRGSRYPEILSDLSASEVQALGEEYLKRTRIQRKTDAPLFIDKLPNNFAHVGLIHLALPNARIIDARRHPLGCCFSAYKQHFARGQNFTYDLLELGRYYRDYVQLMSHFDAVLPGRVHRVIYENMVEDTEGEVRRLLEYCGLPFEQGCLRFYENQRAVRTASSQQVRQPIFRDAVDQWRLYDSWLGPLKEALGPALERYPAGPEF